VDRWLHGLKPARSPRYFANPQFFTDLNIVSAYWLGFILADGNILQNKNGIRIRLQVSDADHLRNLCRDIGYYDCVQIVPKTGFSDYHASAVICCRPLVRQLETMGWQEFKRRGDTRILNVPRDLERYLLRGLFDGDGGLSFRKTRFVSTNAALSFHDLHENVVSWFKNRLVSLLGVNNSKVYQPNASYSVAWNGNQQVLKILRFLYGGSGPFLQRKYDKFQLIGISNSNWERRV